MCDSLGGKVSILVIKELGSSLKTTEREDLVTNRIWFSPYFFNIPDINLEKSAANKSGRRLIIF